MVKGLYGAVSSHWCQFVNAIANPKARLSIQVHEVMRLRDWKLLCSSS
jgi:hypothetical protein